MLRYRPKLGTDHSKEWSCCFCFHVRTGTVILGVWHLMLHLVALGFLAAIVRDPTLLEDLQRESGPITNPNEATLIYHDVDVGALVTVCTLAITLMLIYGASRGKPSHLLPFFCLQIFDFAITVLTATGYLCYLRSIHRLVEEARRVPWREQLLALPPPTLAVVVLGGFFVAVLLKAYCISVVWRCYKYLTMRAHALHSLTPFVISSDGVVSPAAPPYAPAPAPDYSSLLPDYEEAVKQTPPPSYRAATLMAPEPTNGSVTVPKPPHVEQSPAPPANTVVMLPQQGEQARV